MFDEILNYPNKINTIKADSQFNLLPGIKLKMLQKFLRCLPKITFVGEMDIGKYTVKLCNSQKTWSINIKQMYK